MSYMKRMRRGMCVSEIPSNQMSGIGEAEAIFARRNVSRRGENQLERKLILIASHVRNSGNVVK